MIVTTGKMQCMRSTLRDCRGGEKRCKHLRDLVCRKYKQDKNMSNRFRVLWRKTAAKVPKVSMKGLAWILKCSMPRVFNAQGCDPRHGRLRQEDGIFKASLGNLVRQSELGL